MPKPNEVTSTSPATTTALSIATSRELSPVVAEINQHLTSLARLKLAVDTIAASVQDLSPVVAAAQSLTVDSNDAMLTASNHYLFNVREARKKVAAIIAPFKAPLNDTKASVMKLEHALDDPLKKAEDLIKGKLADWDAKEKARVARENWERQEAINAKAREEQRLAREADRQRLEEAEQARRAQEARTAKERREAQEKAEKARLETLKLEEQQRLTAQQVDELAAKPKEQVVKAAGHVTKEIHGWEVGDFHKLVQAVAREEVPECWLTTNDEVIDAAFANDRAMTCATPGIKHVITRQVSGR